MNGIISWYAAHPWALIPTAYLVMSLVAFAAYAVDKSAAKRGAWRTPESTLHTLELLCGWPGAWLAQRLLRHKTCVQYSTRVQRAHAHKPKKGQLWRAGLRQQRW